MARVRGERCVCLRVGAVRENWSLSQHTGKDDGCACEFFVLGVVVVEIVPVTNFEVVLLFFKSALYPHVFGNLLLPPSTEFFRITSFVFDILFCGT